MHEVCIHRGTALSLGHVEGCEIVCAYHGWRFDETGACTRIPQMENQTAIPAKARIASYFVRSAMELFGFSERTSEAATGDSRARLT